MENKWYAEERFRGDGWMILSSEPFDIGRAATQVVALLDYSGPAAEKNARKIAAAKDMYEALTLWSAAEKEELEGARQVGRQIAREKRDAALAKAQGETE